jgi:hypothetical protein
MPLEFQSKSVICGVRALTSRPKRQNQGVKPTSWQSKFGDLGSYSVSWRAKSHKRVIVLPGNRANIFLEEELG